jgi:hypothetical protein
MDQLLPGCLLFVGQSQAERRVERRPLDAVRAIEQSDEPAGLDECFADLGFGRRERRDLSGDADELVPPASR